MTSIITALIVFGVLLYITNGFVRRRKEDVQVRESALEFSKQLNAFVEENEFESEDKQINYLHPFIKLDDESKRIFCGNGKDSAAILPYSKLLGYRLCESGHVRTEDNGFESAATGAIIGNIIDKSYTSAGAIIGAAGKHTEHIPVSDGIELLLQIEDVNRPLIALAYVTPDTDKDTEEYQKGRNEARNDEARLAIVMKQNRKNATPDGKIFHWQYKPGENIAPKGWDNRAENAARKEFGLSYDPEKIKDEDLQ